MPSQTTSLKTIHIEKLVIKEVASLNSISDIKLNDTGWESRVYSFGDGQYFFKFPRSKKVQNLYKYEIAAIKYLNKIDTDVFIQKIIWEHPKNEYFGYLGMAGRPLTEVVDTLSKKQSQSVATTIGLFLKQLHGSSLAGARIKNINSELNQIKRWYYDNLSVINETFNKKQQKLINDLVCSKWPVSINELGSDSVLSHGDLGLHNIICDKDLNMSVIDFGDVAYYDRSKDFLELQINNDFFSNVLKAYGVDNELFLSKIALRQQMIQIISLGYFAGKNDKVNLLKTVNNIKKYLV